MKLDFSNAYHTQTDGETEVVNCIFRSSFKVFGWRAFEVVGSKLKSS